MTSTYLLKNLNHRNIMACLGERSGGLEPVTLEAYTMILRVAGEILSATDAQLARHKISQGRLRLLAQLRLETEEGMHPCDLAERLGISRATITHFLDGLERDGLIERRPSARDGRSLVVRLSASGRRLVGALLPERLRRVQRLMSGLSSPEKRKLVALLSRVEANLPGFSEKK